MDNNFHTALPIESWEVVRSMNAAGQEELWLALDGTASDASTDKLKGVVHPEAIEGMVRIINEQSPLFRNERSAKDAEPVGLDNEHSNHWRDQMGYVARAIADYNLTPEEKRRGVVAPVMRVRVMADLGMSAGQDLKRALEKGVKLGLSIYGQVLKGYKQIERSTGATLEHFVDIALKKIAVTSQPVNSNTWLTIRRSMAGVEEEVSYKEEDSMLIEKSEGASGTEGSSNRASEVAEGSAGTSGSAGTEDLTDVVAWATNNPRLVRSLMNTKREDEALEGAEGTDVARGARTEEARTKEVRAEETVEKEVEIERAVPETEKPEFISRADHESEMNEVRELLRSLPGALKETLGQMEKELEALKEEVRIIGDEPAGRRGDVVRSMEEALGAEKKSNELVPGWESKPVTERVAELRQLRSENPDAANFVVLRKMFQQVKPVEQGLTEEAQALASA